MGGAAMILAASAKDDVMKHGMSAHTVTGGHHRVVTPEEIVVIRNGNGQAPEPVVPSGEDVPLPQAQGLDMLALHPEAYKKIMWKLHKLGIPPGTHRMTQNGKVIEPRTPSG